MREIMDRRLVLAEAKLTPLLQRQVPSLVGEGKTDKQCRNGPLGPSGKGGFPPI
jgi:hypothetical protein